MFVATTEYIFLIAKDAEIKRNDYWMNLSKKALYRMHPEEIDHNLEKYQNYSWCQKVIAYYPIVQNADSIIDLPLLTELVSDNYIEDTVKDLLGVPDEHLDSEDWSKINFGVLCYQTALKHNTK